MCYIFGVGKIETYPILSAIGDFNWLYATGVLFAISALVIIITSLLTKAQDLKSIDGLTYTPRSLSHNHQNRYYHYNNSNHIDCVAILILLILD